MKRVLAAILAAALLTSAAGAYRVPNDDVSFGGAIHSVGINNDPEAQATALKQLGLFRGTNLGFELDRVMTRAEVAAMLVRYFGAEEAAAASAADCPFADVPDWARGYVGWLYQNGITKGVSATDYGAEQPVSGMQFAIFLSRALTGADDVMASGVLTLDESVRFGVAEISADMPRLSRGSAAALSVRALTLPYTRNGGQGTLAQQLIAQGLFSDAQFTVTMWNILNPAYSTDAEGVISVSLAGVTLSRCPLAGLQLDVRMSQDYDSTQPYLYAYRLENGALAIYQVDARTLEPTLIGTRPLPAGAVSIASDNYVMRLGEKDYLIEQYRLAGDDLARFGALLCWDGKALTEVLSADAYGGKAVTLQAEHRPRPSESGISYAAPLSSFTLRTTDAVWRVTQNGVVLLPPLPTGERIYEDERHVVILSEGGTLICADMTDGTEVDRYTVPSGSSLTRQDRWLYGEGGLFLVGQWYETEGAEGRLTRLTDKPVLVVETVRWGAMPSAPYALLGKSGTAAVQLALYAGGEDIILDSEKHKLSSLKITGGVDSALELTARNWADKGEYRYVVNGSTVRVLGYKPDNGTLSDAAQSKQCQKELARLRAAGVDVGE